MTDNLQNASFAILGTGALGGLYGGLLAKAGNEVHFLLRGDYEHVRQHGLRVDTPIGDFHLKSPSVYESPDAMPRVDVVLVCWKTTANASLKAALQAVCRPETIVLVLQNGLDVEQSAAEVVGEERVLGGCCFLCSNKIGPGHVHHLDYGTIVFGEYSPRLRGSISPRMKELVKIFCAARIDLRPAEDLRLARWKKLVWNIPYNGLSVVLDANTAEIMATATTRSLSEALMREVCEAARSNGTEIDEGHIASMLSATEKMVPYDSSMLLDYRAGRRMEVESIFGNPLRAAQQAGFQVPKIEMLYQQLCFLDERNVRS